MFNVCGDGKVSLPDALGYVAGNLLSNGRAKWAESQADKEFVQHSFSEIFKTNLSENWEKVPLHSSPTRTLSNLFWMGLSWAYLQEALGSEINVLDIGCGSGIYFDHRQTWSGGRIANYHGLDIEPHSKWDELQQANSTLSFGQVPVAFTHDYIPAASNLVLTQSAIEHFQFDTLFFEEMAEHIKNISHPFIQIHLVPSAACLPLYLLYGYRQYEPYTIVNNLFAPLRNYPQIHLEIYPMGGPHCTRLHWRTYPWRKLTRRKSTSRKIVESVAYRQEMKRAMLADSAHKNWLPSFYAIVIAANIPNWRSLFTH